MCHQEQLILNRENSSNRKKKHTDKRDLFYTGTQLRYPMTWLIQVKLTFGIDALVFSLVGVFDDLVRRTTILFLRRVSTTGDCCSLAQLPVSPAADVVSVVVTSACVDTRSSGSVHIMHRLQLSAVTDIMHNLQPSAVTDIMHRLQPSAVTDIMHRLQPSAVTDVKCYHLLSKLLVSLYNHAINCPDTDHQTYNNHERKEQPLIN